MSKSGGEIASGEAGRWWFLKRTNNCSCDADSCTQLVYFEYQISILAPKYKVCVTQHIEKLSKLVCKMYEISNVVYVCFKLQI